MGNYEQLPEQGSHLISSHTPLESSNVSNNHDHEDAPANIEHSRYRSIIRRSLLILLRGVIFILFFFFIISLPLGLSLTLAAPPNFIVLIIKFASNQPLLAIPVFITVLLLIAFVLFSDFRQRSRYKSIHLSGLFLIGSRIDIDKGKDNTIAPITTSVVGDALRKWHIEKIKAWIKEDPKLKDDLEFMLDDNQDIKQVSLQASNDLQALQERVNLLEKRLHEKHKVLLKKATWREQITTLNNIAGIIVAVPVFIALITSIIAFIYWLFH